MTVLGFHLGRVHRRMAEYGQTYGKIQTDVWQNTVRRRMARYSLASYGKIQSDDLGKIQSDDVWQDIVR